MVDELATKKLDNIPPEQLESFINNLFDATNKGIEHLLNVIKEDEKVPIDKNI